MFVGIVPWKPALRFSGRLATEDSHTIEALLPVNQTMIPSAFKHIDGKIFALYLDFLEAGNIGLLVSKPLEKTRQPRVGAVNIE